MENQPSRKLEGDHMRDASEHAPWLNDAERWRAEHRRLLGLLARAQEAVLEQDAALDSHIRAIHEHETNRLRHELSMSNPPAKGDLTAIHEEHEVSHVQVRDAHSRMADHHKRVLMQIEQLVGTLSQPM